MSADVTEIFQEIIEKACIVKEKQLLKFKLMQADEDELHKHLESLSRNQNKVAMPEMMELKNQHDRLASELEKLGIEKTAVKEKMNQVRHKVTSLGDERNRQREQLVLPRSRYSVNVFRDMSNVKWQEERQPNEVKGYVRHKGGSMKTFCFDKEKQSNFFIVNKVWEMGEEDLDVPSS